MVGWKWRCGSAYHILILLVVVYVSHYAEGCWGKTAPNYGDMTGDYDLLVGSDLVLNCSLNSHFIQIDSQRNHTYYVNSSNLVFKKGSRISSDHVLRLDALTAQLRISNATKEHSGIYHCKVTLPEITSVPVVCSSKVSVGYPPKSVSNFSCVSRNFENLTCSWNVEASGIQTKYSLYKNHFLSSFFQTPLLQHCPEETSNSTFCQWRDDTDPPYQTNGKMLTFVVQGNNSLGSSNDTFTVNHFEIVIPNPPEMLTVVQVEKQDILLHWQPPKKLTTMTNKPVLQYEMWVEELVDNPSEKKVINVGNDTTTYLVSDLIPFVSYNISLRCRSNYTDKDDMWSSTVSVVAQMKPDVPYITPDVISDAFELHYYDNYRTATLYWKPVATKHYNGEKFQYHIVCFSNESSENSLLPIYSKNTSATFVNFENLQKNITYIFKIYSSNMEGLSANYKVIVVNNQENIPPGPKDVIVISHDPGHYELSWTLTTSFDISGYTVLWCSSLKPWRSRCDGPIQWSRNNLTGSNISLNLTDSTTNYQFAITSNTEISSSGMHWATCIVPYKTPLGKIDYIIVEQKNSTSLKVMWRLNCAAQKAVVKNFEIVYCKQNRGGICKERESVIIDEPSAESYLLYDLDPYSNYSIVLRAFNLAGIASEDSDRRFQTTLQGAPSDSPNELMVIPKPNASLFISWQPPSIPNGIITHYNIYYNGAKKTFQVDSTSQSSFEIELHQLQYYTNYSVKLEACVFKDCSPMSREVVARTDVGVPAYMNPPRVEGLNNTHFQISWTAPSQPNGPIDFYEIQWKPQKAQNNTSHQVEIQKKNVTLGLSTVIELECTEVENTGVQFLFFIRAANIKNNQALFGSFSDSTKTQACVLSQGSVMIIAIAIGASLGFVVFLCLIWYFIKWMRDEIHQVKSITVLLPKGLEGPEANPLKNYDNFKNGLSPQTVPVTGIERLSYVIDDSDKNRHGSGSSQFSNSSADELIYKTGKCTKFGRKPSGESSGCSSMSSNATRVHLSSDSGTESDFGVPPSPEVFMEQNNLSNHKSMLPILMEVHDPQVHEALNENIKNSNTNKLLDNYTNFMNGMVLKIDQPYSKFGIAGSPNSYSTLRSVNPLVFYSSNLANSEPSVFDADFTTARNQANIAPYSKIGLAKSTTDLQAMSTMTHEMGYSKFGLSPSINHAWPSGQPNMPTVAMFMVDSPHKDNIEWKDIKGFLKNQKLRKENIKVSEVNGDGCNMSPYITIKQNSDSGLGCDIDSGYIKFGLSKNIVKCSSPGYISLHEIQSLKNDASPGSVVSPEIATPNQLSEETLLTSSNFNMPQSAKDIISSNHSLLESAKVIPNGEDCSDINLYANRIINMQGDVDNGRANNEPLLHPASSHSFNIKTNCGEESNCALLSHANKLIDSSNCNSSVMVDSRDVAPLLHGSQLSSSRESECVQPISCSSRIGTKRNGYVPLSHLSNPVKDNASSHVPNASQLGIMSTKNCDFQNGRCENDDLNHGAMLNEGHLANVWVEDELSKYNSGSIMCPLQPYGKSSIVKTESPKLHLQNQMNYVNGSLKYILKPLPKMESEICEV